MLQTKISCDTEPSKGKIKLQRIYRPISGIRSKTCKRVDRNHINFNIMKSNNLKRFTAPLAVVILGGAGAFFTASMGSVKAVDERPAYRYISQQDPCHQEEVRCQTELADEICSYGSTQLFGKVNEDSPNNNCNLPMYKVPN